MTLGGLPMLALGSPLVLVGCGLLALELPCPPAGLLSMLAGLRTPPLAPLLGQDLRGHDEQSNKEDSADDDHDDREGAHDRFLPQRGGALTITDAAAQRALTCGP